MTSPQAGLEKALMARAGRMPPRVVATKYTKQQAKNLPSTMAVTPTGAVSKAWSVLFFWSSHMLRMVMMGMIIMLKLNMVANTEEM